MNDLIKNKMQRKIKKWILGFVISNLVFIMSFFFVLMIIISITGGIGGGSSASATNCSNSENTQDNGSAQTGIGIEIPSSEIQTVKLVFRSLQNWDGKTRALPVDNGYVSSEFNTVDSAHSEPHNGTDYASVGNLYALVDGVVVSSGFNTARGNLIAVAFKGTDGTPYTYLYQHLASKAKKNVGEKVKMGEVLGTSGNTGKSSGVHLHVEVELASLTNEVPRWVATFPTNPKVQFNAVKFFQLPKTINGNDGNIGLGDKGAGESGNRCSKGREVTNLEGNSNAEKIFNELVKNQDFTKEGASGIIGNLMQESGCDPKSIQKGGPGRGIMQWTESERWDSLVKWAKSVNKDEWDLSSQIEWMIMELRQYKAYDYFKGIKNVEEATDHFEKKMERAGKPEMANRYKYALDAMAKFGK